MRRHFVLSLALLFIALGVPSNAQSGERRQRVREGAPLEVRCSLRVDQRADWRLDGGALPADLRPAPEAAPAAQLEVRLAAPAARPHHAGLYTCARPPGDRVRVLLEPGAGSETSTAGSAAAEAADEAASQPGVPLAPFSYDVGRAFSLTCNLTGAAYAWKKNGTSLERVAALSKRYSLEEGGAVLRLAGRSSEEDYGNYTCEAGGAAQGWAVRATPVAKLQHNLNVVENQKLKVTCKLLGKPYPAVAWTFTNDSLNGTDVVEALGAAVELQPSEQGVPGAVLVLAAAQRWHAGVYACVPDGGVLATTTLRVKDQFAALWPFLGICAEVFVLCAIILVYEKRRTKPDLDDSDTDNHDQKKS